MERVSFAQLDRVSFAQLPTDVQSEMRRLVRLCELGRSDEVVEELPSVIARYPGYVTARFLLGRELRKKGDRARARKVFEEAALLAPDNDEVRMGLTWARFDARDYAAAVRLARTLVDSPVHKGEALAILARVEETQGNVAGAARLFLEAYEARPRIPWLEAHCRLASLPFDLGSESTPTAWRLSPAQRLWLFRSVECDLLEVAYGKGLTLRAEQQLAGGCDHGTHFVRHWATLAQVDVAPLYQALAARGGLCDCEVLFNAAAVDTDVLRSVLISGTLEGDALRAIKALDERVVAAHPLPPTLSANANADQRGDRLSYEPLGGTGTSFLRFGVQLGSGTLVGDVLEAFARAALANTVLQLLLVYPDLDHAAEVVTVREGQVVVTSIASGVAAPPEAARWIRADLAAMRAIQPTSTPPVWQDRIGLPAVMTEPHLLLHKHNKGWFVADLQGGPLQRLDVDASSLAVGPGHRHVAWTTPHRRVVDLVVEDVATGTRTRFERGDVRGPLSFSPDGRTLYATVAGNVVAFDVTTGEGRSIGPGREATLSPDGARLAVVSDGNLAIWSTGGQRVATLRGRSPLWLGTGQRLAFLAKTEREGWQAFLFDVDGGSVQRLSPVSEEASALSFSEGSVVMALRKQRREHPLDGGRFRIDDDEALVQCDAPGSARTLFASEQGYMRIVRPLAHPARPLVAFLTQDAPQVGRRVVVVAEGGPPRTLVEGDLSPVAWLA